MGEVIRFPRPIRRQDGEAEMPAAEYIDIASRAAAAARRMALGENASARPISELRWLASDERFRRGLAAALLDGDLSRIEGTLAAASSPKAKAAAARVASARRALGLGEADGKARTSA